MKLYPFPDTDEAYADLLALRSLLDPEAHLTIDLLRAEAQDLAAGHAVTHVLGSIADQVVASGSYWHSTRTADGPYSFSFSVHPAYQATAVPAQMHGYLLASMAQANPTAIVSQVTEDADYRIRLLEADHFALKMRFPRSRVPVMAVETAAYADQLVQLAAQGIEFVTLRDVMKADAHWQHNVWRLFTIIEQDVPSPEAVEITPFEQYAEYYTVDWFQPESWALALDTTQEDAARYVGMSVVNTMTSRTDALFAGITGVVPSHRRRKIATMLKVQSVAYAQQQGYRYIYTDNEENNPMYELNLQLGFEPLPALLYYKQELD